MGPFFSIFLLVLFVANSRCTLLPSIISPCYQSDPELNKCIENNIRKAGPTFAKGIPELGVPSLDPANLGIIRLKNPTLELTFSDAELTGLSNFKLNSFKINTESKNAALHFTTNVTLRGHYNMHGQVLLLPVTGDGQAKIRITNLDIKLHYQYEISNAGFWRIVKYEETHKMDRVQSRFTNLFGGQNKELAKAFHSIVNENWQVVMDELAPELTGHVIGVCAETVGKFYASVPASELLKD